MNRVGSDSIRITVEGMLVLLHAALGRHVRAYKCFPGKPMGYTFYNNCWA